MLAVILGVGEMHEPKVSALYAKTGLHLGFCSGGGKIALHAVHYNIYSKISRGGGGGQTSSKAGGGRIPPPVPAPSLKKTESIIVSI